MRRRSPSRPSAIRRRSAFVAVLAGVALFGGVHAVVGGPVHCSGQHACR